MEYRKLREMAEISISNVDKKTAENEKEVRLCNFVDVYRNWAITENMIPNFMVASAKESEIEKYTLHKGDVCITKDSETNLFFNHLSKGTHIVGYEARVTMPGEFSVGIATAQSQQAAQVTAHSAGKLVTVTK